MDKMFNYKVVVNSSSTAVKYKMMVGNYENFCNKWERQCILHLDRLLCTGVLYNEEL